jgi:hypothetical protein
MPEATPRPSPRKYAGPLVIIAAFATGAALTWAVTRPPAPVDPADTATVEAPRAPPAPVLAAPPLGRGQLLAAARAATAAYAAGQPAPAGQTDLVGRRFEVRIPFGCSGPQAEPAGAQAWWNYDSARQTLTLAARPVDWTAAPPVPLVTGADVEAVEGFWLPRPWTDAETCPPRAAGPLAAPARLVPPTPQTLGVASVFRAAGSRVLRRGARPYQVVRKVSPDDLAAVGEFHLVLSGRVAAIRDGQPVACRAETSDQRPVCLIAVEFDRVAFEDAAGDALAEWRS